jgi:hypothetical protein
MKFSEAVAKIENCIDPKWMECNYVNIHTRECPIPKYRDDDVFHNLIDS